MLNEKYEPITESQYYILLCLSYKDSYGYEIMRLAKELSCGRVSIGPGTMYGALGNMIKKGWIIEVNKARKRRMYSLTSQGGDILDKEIHRLETMLHCACHIGRAKPPSSVGADEGASGNIV